MIGETVGLVVSGCVCVVVLILSWVPILAAAEQIWDATQGKE